jgi:hypothetical protein
MRTHAGLCGAALALVRGCTRLRGTHAGMCGCVRDRVGAGAGSIASVLDSCGHVRARNGSVGLVETMASGCVVICGADAGFVWACTGRVWTCASICGPVLVLGAALHGHDGLDMGSARASVGITLGRAGLCGPVLDPCAPNGSHAFRFVRQLAL